MRVDHIVFWVADPLRSVAFYDRILGLKGVRLEEFEAGKILFPSVRIADDAIIDFMPMKAAPIVNSISGSAGSAGNKVNHLCLSMSQEEYRALRGRLEAEGIAVPKTMKDSFGAQGQAPEAIYFADPDGNVIEARYY